MTNPCFCGACTTNFDFRLTPTPEGPRCDDCLAVMVEENPETFAIIDCECGDMDCGGCTTTFEITTPEEMTYVIVCEGEDMPEGWDE